MTSSTDLRAILRGGTLLLDAAMGTALVARGLSGPAPSRNLSHPEDVLAVHRAQVAAGAELVLTNTFVGAAPEEARAGLDLARASGARFVGASLWAGLPDLEEQIKRLAGADCVWVESAVDAEQASSALRRALQSTSLPIVITCAMRRAPLRALREAGAIAAGYNCTPWPDDASDADVVKADWGGLDPAAWAKAVPRARLRGGCCGTDARYLSALRETER